MNYVSMLSNENFEKVEPYISSATYLAVGIWGICGRGAQTIEWVKHPLTIDGFFFYSGVNALISGATIPARNHFANLRQYEGLVTAALYAFNATVFSLYSIYYSNNPISGFDILRLSLFPLVIKTVMYGIHALGLKTLKNVFLPNGSIVDRLQNPQNVQNLSLNDFNTCKTELEQGDHQKWKRWSISMQIAFNASAENHKIPFLPFTNLSEKSNFTNEELILIEKVNRGNYSLEYLKFLFDHDRVPHKKHIIKQKLSFLDFEDSFDPRSLKNNQIVWYFHYFITHPSKWDKFSFEKQIQFKNKLALEFSKQLFFFPQKVTDLQALPPEIVKALHDQYTTNLEQWVVLLPPIQQALNNLFEKGLGKIPVPDSPDSIKAFRPDMLGAYTKAFNAKEFSIDSFPSVFYEAFIEAYQTNGGVEKPKWIT